MCAGSRYVQRDIPVPLRTLDLGTNMWRQAPLAPPSAALVAKAHSLRDWAWLSNGSTSCRIFFTRTPQASFRKKFYAYLVLLASLVPRFHGSQRMSEKKRKTFSAQQKAKVVIEAIRGLKTVNEVSHPGIKIIIAWEIACFGVLSYFWKANESDFFFIICVKVF